jgi:histidinol-phosphate/aromatic aminotransferase/cobyric acid decarboxylase-like protein
MSAAGEDRLPPRGLAVASWGTPAEAMLDLRYLPDEGGWLDPDPARVWADVMQASGDLGAALAASYPVDDPYGGSRGAAPVGRFFDVALAPGQVTFAAGVTGLLHSTAQLAGTGAVVAPELVHPDLEAWAASRGAAIRLVPGTVSADALLSAIAAVRPALVHLDRPAFGNEVLGLGDVQRIAAGAAAVGAPLVVDEAAAPYLLPAASAVTLAGHTDNLVVLRGFTKAYSLGGLRAGFAVASPGVADRVRAVVPPLQVGEAALAVALRLLEEGDACARLRSRIRETKPRSAALLERAGLEVDAGHPDVPALVVDDAGGAATRLLAPLGIVGLRPALAPRARVGACELVHLRTPIDDERIELLGRLLASARASVAAAAAEAAGSGARS